MNSFASKIIVVNNTAAEKLGQQGQVTLAKKYIHMSQNPKDSIPLTQQAPFRAVRDSAVIRDSENTFCRIKGLRLELVKIIRKTSQNCGHGSPHLSSPRP